MYLCITIGAGLLLLAFLETLKNRFTTIVAVFGRTAFFYYILHIYFINVIAAICFFAKGHTMQQAIKSAPDLPFMFVLPGEGFSLTGVYLVWAVVIIILYPLCKSYDRYKSRHKEKWWLSYL